MSDDPQQPAPGGLPSWVPKNAITFSVVFSFIWATLGHAGAMTMWRDDWPALLVYLGLGLGLSWAKDIAAAHAEARLTEAQAKLAAAPDAGVTGK